MGAAAGIGTQLKQATSVIGGLTSIGGLSLSADTIESTNLSSTGGYREFIGGLKDGGEVSLSGQFDYDSESNQSILYSAFQSGAVLPFTIVFPSAIGATWTFNAVVTGFETSVEVEDLVSFDCTLKVSGQPTLAATAGGS